MKRRQIYIWGFCVVMLVLWVLAPDTKVSGTTFSPKPDGTKAAFVTLSQLGLPVKQWFQPFEELMTQGARGTVILISPSELPRSKARLEPLLTWVESGNRFIYFASLWDSGRELRRLLDLEEWSDTSTAAEAVLDSKPKPTALLCPEDLPPHRCPKESYVTLPPRLGFAPPKDAQIVSGTPNSANILRLTRGQGEIWIVAGTSIIENDSVDQADNLRFLLSLISGSESIYFDEFHHGILEPLAGGRQEQSRGLWVVLSLLGAWLLLGALSRAVRFGPPRPEKPRIAASTADFVAVYGKLHQDKGAASLLKHYVSAWTSRTGLRLGAGAHLTPDQLTEYLLEGKRISVQDAAELKRQIEILAIASDTRTLTQAQAQQRAVNYLEAVIPKMVPTSLKTEGITS